MTKRTASGTLIEPMFSTSLSLRECVTCREVAKNATFLLPCLHVVCPDCAKDILDEAQRTSNQPRCVDCGEFFPETAMLNVPKDDQLVVERTVCATHPTEDAEAYCTECQLLQCANCCNSEPEHAHISPKQALSDIKTMITTTVTQVAEFLPAVEQAIRKHRKKLSELEKKRSDLEKHLNASATLGEFEKHKLAEREKRITELQQQEKAETLQIDDLETAKSFVAIAQQQANAVSAVAGDFFTPTILNLNNLVKTRLSNLRTGVADALIPVAIFGRVSWNMKVTNNGNTVTKTIEDYSYGYAICDDGCSNGVRSWRITIHSIAKSIMIGVFLSDDLPSCSDSYGDANNWAVGNGGIYKAGSYSVEDRVKFAKGDVVILKVDCGKRTLSVQNITQAWLLNVEKIPAPRPMYFPHINLAWQNDSVTIEAIQS